EEEIVDAGISPQAAREMMRLKMRFAFGTIRATEELVDSLIVENDPVEIRNGVFINRLRVNVFEFQYQGDSAIVDLNLGPNESYEPSYQLGFHNIPREYFAVVHTGEGDGWDSNRPCMSSLLMFQGKIYLIDAGPNVVHSLKALGISTNEIEGLFHTHAHDDHFAGLMSLMRSDHKIKYFACPLVRTSVVKKLSALLSVDEEGFGNYFDVHDLVISKWNEINGLEVKPIFSPHPLETHVFVFRAVCEDGFRSYAHFADIVSLDVLENMITENISEPGVSRECFEKVKHTYLERYDLKKLDIGGGLIHGNAEDFKDDDSGKIILAHTSTELSNEQKAFGSGAAFGMIDTLISGHQDYIRRYAFLFLQSCFPSVPRDQIDVLLNNPVVTFNPGSILIKSGEINKYHYLILTGEVETIQSESGKSSMMSAGGCVGDVAGLKETVAKETFRAVNFVQTLQIPCNLCLEFLKRNRLLDDDINHLQERRMLLKNTWLFGEGISYAIQDRLAREISTFAYQAGADVPLKDRPGLFLTKRGKLQLYLDTDVFDIFEVGDFFGESDVLFRTPPLFKVKALDAVEVYHIPREALLDIPIVYWKLLETYEKRMRLILDPQLSSIPIFQWRDEYSSGIREMDTDHKTLFEAAQSLCEGINAGKSESVLENTFKFLIKYTEDHFKKEEEMMREHIFPEYEAHRKKHEDLKRQALDLEKKFTEGKMQIDMSFIKFFKDWIIDHILTEDRKYGPYFNEKGLY
ncbi:MAG: bacteriohemerythrin, partial [Thermodesulfobacteriota bacterium]|nr:bacteriohemerythrin [Thermodesulfobacteriota bacterium]